LKKRATGVNSDIIDKDTRLLPNSLSPSGTQTWLKDKLEGAPTGESDLEWTSDCDGTRGYAQSFHDAMEENRSFQHAAAAPPFGLAELMISIENGCIPS
jgi:hypothetical protein